MKEKKGWKKNHKERKKIWLVVKRTINQSPKKGAAILLAQKKATKVTQVVASGCLVTRARPGRP
jgi:hypothetical protein